MNGRDLFLGLSYISRKYIDEAEQDTISGGKGAYEAHRSGKKLLHKSLLIAAVIAAMLFLMGAAVYTHWSGSLQHRYNPTENAKQQAEKSGLSVMYEESKPEDGSILSATDQGVTVSLVQTLVDQSQAKIVLRVEGFTPPEDFKIQPWAWMDTPAALGGDEHFWTSFHQEFDDGIIQNDAGEYIYTDGTPAEKIIEGEYQEKFLKGRYIKEDGSLELMLQFVLDDTSGACLGKEMELHFTGFGTNTYVGKADSDFEKTVDGHWDLRFPLTGSGEGIKATPNVRLSDNVTLTQVEIGEISIKTQYKTDTYFSEWEQLGILQPDIAGVKLKDGTLIQFYTSSEGYEDQDKLIYFKEAHAVDGVVDLDQVESLVYYERWDPDPSGQGSVPVYKYVPIG